MEFQNISNSLPMSPEAVQCFLVHASKVKDLVRNGLCFILLSMIIILSITEDEHDHSELLSQIRGRFLHLLQRQLASIGVEREFDEYKLNLMMANIEGLCKFLPCMLGDKS